MEYSIIIELYTLYASELIYNNNSHFQALLEWIHSM